MSAGWRGLAAEFNPFLPSACSIRAYFFHVGAETQATTLLTDSSCYRSDSSGTLDADFLMVPQAKLVESNTRATYFCGAISKDVVISSKSWKEL